MRDSKPRLAAVVLAAICCAMFSAAAPPESLEPPPQSDTRIMTDPEKQLKQTLLEMIDRLNLGYEQAQAIEPIMRDWVDQMARLWDKYGGQHGPEPVRQFAAERREAQKKVFERLGEVLSQEQLDDYAEMILEKRRKLGRQEPSPAGPEGH